MQIRLTSSFFYGKRPTNFIQLLTFYIHSLNLTSTDPRPQHDCNTTELSPVKFLMLRLSRRKISFDQEKIGTEMVSSPSGPEKNA